MADLSKPTKLFQMRTGRGLARTYPSLGARPDRRREPETEYRPMMAYSPGAPPAASPRLPVAVSHLLSRSR